MEHSVELDNLLTELQNELLGMQIKDDYCETDKMKWLFQHIEEQLVIIGITKE